jgi:hypothetical protein
MLPGLRNEINTTIKAIPVTNRVIPTAGAIVPDPNSAFIHLQDWASTQGYAFVIASSNNIRTRFNYIHYQVKTHNTRKLTEKDLHFVLS